MGHQCSVQCLRHWTSPQPPSYPRVWNISMCKATFLPPLPYAAPPSVKWEKNSSRPSNQSNKQNSQLNDNSETTNSFVQRSSITAESPSDHRQQPTCPISSPNAWDQKRSWSWEAIVEGAQCISIQHNTRNPNHGFRTFLDNSFLAYTFHKFWLEAPDTKK